MGYKWEAFLSLADFIQKRSAHDNTMDFLAKCNACVLLTTTGGVFWSNITGIYVRVGYNLWCMRLHVKCCTSHQITYCLTKAVLFFPYCNDCFFLIYLCAFFFGMFGFFLMIMIVASSVFFFLFSVHTLVSTVARSLACAFWLFASTLSSQYQSLRYISQHRSLIYMSAFQFCVSFCTFSRCVALHFNCGCMALKKNWTVFFSENIDCLGL